MKGSPVRVRLEACKADDRFSVVCFSFIYYCALMDNDVRAACQDEGYGSISGIRRRTYMIRLGMIGTGKIVHMFAQAALKSGNYHLEAVCSRDKERGKAFAKEYGISQVTVSLEELAEMKDVDAVYIASPNSCHFSQSMMMLRGGKHVICEKPVVPSVRELQELLEEAKKLQVILMEAMRTAFDPGLKKLEELIPLIGPVRRATLEYGKYSSRYDAFLNGEILNAFNPSLANAAVMDIGVYAVYGLVRLFGKPEEIRGLNVKLSNGMEGIGTILARYPGMISEILYSKITDTIGESQIQGEKGNILVDMISEPSRITLKLRNQKEQVFRLTKDPNPLYEEAKVLASILENRDFQRAEWYQKQTAVQIGIIEEVRRQTGIIFHGEADTL